MSKGIDSGSDRWDSVKLRGWKRNANCKRLATILAEPI
jgi:hypothetical protein